MTDLREGVPNLISIAVALYAGYVDKNNAIII